MKTYVTIIMIIAMGVSSYYAQVPNGFREIKLPNPPKVNQQIQSDYNGWTVATEEIQNYLENITVYDGTPGELASLIPDRTFKNKSGFYSVWSFKSQSKRDAWIKCEFSKTTITLSKPLPAGIKELRIYYNAGIKIDGYFQIKKVLYR